MTFRQFFKPDYQVTESISLDQKYRKLPKTFGPKMSDAPLMLMPSVPAGRLPFEI